MPSTGKADAIINLTRITVRPEKRKELCQTISSLIDPVKREKGCLNYGCYEETDDGNTFVLIGEWETPADWNNHLYSNSLAVLLGSISLLCDISHLDFKLLSHITSGEAMTRANMGCHTH
ncbi:MAG: antibiotic biosynthesis monooxygenase family protein [Pyrinomonadaceae bacterium]